MTDPIDDAGTDKRLAALLADYAAPTPDDGFSDAVLRAAQAEAETSVQGLDVDAFKPARHPVRRSWILSLASGLVAGLLWVRLGIDVPDVPETSEWSALMQSGWTLYALAGLGLAGLFVVVEAESH